MAKKQDTQQDAHAELIARLGTDNPPTDDELREARKQLRQDLDEALPKDGPVDLPAAKVLRKAIGRIDDELTERREAAEAERAEAQKLLEGLDDVTDDDETDEDDADEDDDFEDDDDGADEDDDESDTEDWEE